MEENNSLRHPQSTIAATRFVRNDILVGSQSASPSYRPGKAGRRAHGGGAAAETFRLSASDYWAGLQPDIGFVRTPANSQFPSFGREEGLPSAADRGAALRQAMDVIFGNTDFPQEQGIQDNGGIKDLFASVDQVARPN
jgi:hypothetical protein